MLHLRVPGVSSGKKVVAEIGSRVCRRKSIISAVGSGANGVRPEVGGGGIEANRRRGDELLLCCIGVSVDARVRAGVGLPKGLWRGL